MDLLLDAVCVVDRDGYFLFVSAASEHIFGYPPEEMIGRPVIDFVRPGDRERTQQAVNDVSSFCRSLVVSPTPGIDSFNQLEGGGDGPFGQIVETCPDC